MTSRFKIAIYLALAIVLALLAVRLFRTLGRMERGGAQMAVILDVMSFAEANELRMPNDWNEFEAWCATRPNNNHWRADDLRALYTLSWGTPLAELDLNNAVLIRVLNPKRSSISQENANKYMRCFAMAALMSSNAVPLRQTDEQARSLVEGARADTLAP